ncbi:unnamed protein product, partial [Prorocentrum cordatum]
QSQTLGAAPLPPAPGAWPPRCPRLLLALPPPPRAAPRAPPPRPAIGRARRGWTPNRATGAG